MDAIASKNKKKKIRKIRRVNEEKLRLFAILGCLLLTILIIFGLIFRACTRDDRVSPYGTPDPAYDDGRPYIDVQLLRRMNIQGHVFLPMGCGASSFIMWEIREAAPSPIGIILKG